VISRLKKPQLHIVIENTPGRERGFNPIQYIDTLKKDLLPLYDGLLHFQQDNASIHTAKAVEILFLEHMVSLLEWPLYSPDLNPIKHVRNLLKRRLFNYSHISSVSMEIWLI
jgi:transposase